MGVSVYPAVHLFQLYIQLLFMCGSCISNCCLCVVSVYTAVVHLLQLYIQLKDGLWPLSAYLCKSLYYVYYVFLMASAFSLTAMSLERSVSYCHVS